MEKKDDRLVLRLTPTEKKKLQQEAIEKNTTLSLLIRDRIFGGYKHLNQQLDQALKELDEKTIELEKLK